MNAEAVHYFIAESAPNGIFLGLSRIPIPQAVDGAEQSLLSLATQIAPVQYLREECFWIVSVTSPPHTGR